MGTNSTGGSLLNCTQRWSQYYHQGYCHRMYLWCIVVFFVASVLFYLFECVRLQQSYNASDDCFVNMADILIYKDLSKYS